MTHPDRTNARTLAQQYEHAGKPTEWFEVLYAQAKNGDAIVPWADLKANPNLVQWLDEHQVQGHGKTALKIGCGLGDDAEALHNRGFKVIGFDISASAIAWCHERFPNAAVQYVVADLLNPPSTWQNAFDFVLEAYTLQVLPSSLRPAAIQQIANFVAPGGQLLVINRGRDSDEDPGQMPYPLTKSEVMQFATEDLDVVSFEDYWDKESPPVRRFRSVFRKQPFSREKQSNISP